MACLQRQSLLHQIWHWEAQWWVDWYFEMDTWYFIGGYGGDGVSTTYWITRDGMACTSWRWAVSTLFRSAKVSNLLSWLLASRPTLPTWARNNAHLDLGEKVLSSYKWSDLVASSIFGISCCYWTCSSWRDPLQGWFLIIEIAPYERRPSCRTFMLISGICSFATIRGITRS